MDKERREKAVTVSLTASEREALKKIADAWDRSISWTVGRLALEAVDRDQSHTFRIVSKSD